ncbi:MAG TPA: site-specific DNA-methyltransferase, partial [Candidatus Nanoarchaeia archaeon]
NTFVRIGAVDAPVTLSEIRETLQECKENNIKSLDVLGWEWEMGLHDLIKEEAERFGVKLTTLQIPREVMELNIKDPKIKEDIQFYELAYLDVESRVDGKKAIITLKDFIIPNPELLPQEVKDKVKNWSAFIDYWAVDWLFNQHEEESEEDDTFHNMNQEYRTRKDPKLNLFMQHEYEKPGKYNVLVKVIDIFGNDTTKLVELKV